MPSEIKTNNFFDTPILKINKEQFTSLVKGKNFFTDKIISNGFKSPNDEWMSEEYEEWVILLKGRAKIEFENGEVLNLKAGDYLRIPANTKHRILYTSKKPFCYWLAIHFK